MSSTQLNPTYFPGIDALKGFLILQVVLTHALPGSNLTFVMYTYHMPLFMAISGFLIKRERLKELSFNQLLKKYLYRLIIPWLIAFVFYNVFDKGVLLLQLTWTEMIGLFLYPYYHLWFIPGLLWMIFLLWLIEHRNGRIVLLLPIAFLITGSWLFHFFWVDNTYQTTYLGYYLIGDKRYFIYFFFFLFSYYLKNFRSDLLARISPTKMIVLLLVVLPILIVGNYLPISLTRSGYYMIFYLLFNLSLIYTVLSYGIKLNIKNRILLFSNKYSMVIYLYHYVLIVLLHHPITNYFGHNLVSAAILFTITCSLLLPTIYLLSNISFIDFYVFGNVKKKPRSKKMNTQDASVFTIKNITKSLPKN